MSNNKKLDSDQKDRVVKRDDFRESVKEIHDPTRQNNRTDPERKQEPTKSTGPNVTPDKKQ